MSRRFASSQRTDWRCDDTPQCRSPGLATGETRDRPAQAYATIANMHSPPVHHNGGNKISIRMEALSDTIDATSAFGKNGFRRKDLRRRRIEATTISVHDGWRNARACGDSSRVSPLARPGLQKSMPPDAEVGRRQRRSSCWTSLRCLVALHHCDERIDVATTRHATIIHKQIQPLSHT